MRKQKQFSIKTNTTNKNNFQYKQDYSQQQQIDCRTPEKFYTNTNITSMYL